MINKNNIKKYWDCLGIFAVFNTFFNFWTKLNITSSESKWITIVIQLIFFLVYVFLFWQVLNLHDKSKDLSEYSGYSGSVKFFIEIDLLKSWEKVILSSISISSLVLTDEKISDISSLLKGMVTGFLIITSMFYLALYIISKNSQQVRCKNIVYWGYGLSIILPIFSMAIPMFILVEVEPCIAFIITLAIVAILVIRLWCSKRKI